MQFHLERKTEATLSPEDELPTFFAKGKMETRKQPTTQAIPSEEIVTEPQEELHPIFAVDKRALKVFSTIFFVPLRRAQPGEVAWSSFFMRW